MNYNRFVMANKKMWSIICLLLSLLLLFIPWSGDYNTSYIRDAIVWGVSETNYTTEEVFAIADNADNGMSPFELIQYSFCYADTLLGYRTGGLEGYFSAQYALMYRLYAIWMIMTIAVHGIVAVLHLFNRRFRGFVSPAAISVILGLFLYFRFHGDISNLNTWGFVSLIASLLSCLLWDMHCKQIENDEKTG